MFFSEARMFICLKTEVRILADHEILAILRVNADEEEARVLIPLRPRAPERGCLWGLAAGPLCLPHRALSSAAQDLWGGVRRVSIIYLSRVQQRGVRVSPL